MIYSLTFKSLLEEERNNVYACHANNHGQGYYVFDCTPDEKWREERKVKIDQLQEIVKKRAGSIK